MRIANIEQVVNVLQAVILTDGERMVLTPTYHVFRMYGVHHVVRPAPFEGHRLRGAQLVLTVPAKSVVVLELRRALALPGDV